MAPSTKPPDGLKINYSTVLFYLTVIAAIVSGFWFTYDRIATVNFQAGQEAERRIQQEQKMADLQKQILILEAKQKAGGQ